MRPRVLLAALVVVLTIAAAQRLHDGFRHLVSRPGNPIDLAYRHDDVHTWFAGQPPYARGHSVYPPATQVMLWPLLGWLDLLGAQRLWALTTVLALGWLAALLVRASGVRTPLARLAVVLLVPAVYATRAVIVNGQLVLHLLPCLISAALLLDRGRPGWRRDLGAAACILFGLVKPTVGAPFVWLVFSAEQPIRPVLLVVIGYAALTLVAAAFQPESVASLIAQWGTKASGQAPDAAVQAHANVHSWLLALGLERGNALASLTVLALVGWWAWRYRRVDVWIRLAVVAVVARFWTAHFRYDDLLILIPLIALCRLARSAAPARADTAAGVLCVLTAASLLAPARLFFLPSPWTPIFEGAQTAVWLCALALLVRRAHQDAAAVQGRRRSSTVC